MAYTYRVGRNQPRNVYRVPAGGTPDDGEYIGVFFDARDAAFVVGVLNGVDKKIDQLIPDALRRTADILDEMNPVDPVAALRRIADAGELACHRTVARLPDRHAPTSCPRSRLPTAPQPLGRRLAL